MRGNSAIALHLWNIQPPIQSSLEALTRRSSCPQHQNIKITARRSAAFKMLNFVVEDVLPVASSVAGCDGIELVVGASAALSSSALQPASAIVALSHISPPGIFTLVSSHVSGHSSWSSASVELCAAHQDDATRV